VVSAHARIVGLLVVLATCGCSARFIYDDVDAGDTGVDANDGAIDVVYDAQIRTATPPPPHTYSPNGGLCPFAPCGPNSVCDEVSGWCCGGRWIGGACKCGDDDGCMPPSVCCPASGGPAGAGACVASVGLCPGAH
jgi:hypothetical protein